MTVEGAEDDIAAPGQTRAAHALCTSIPSRRREQVLVDACGHFSLFHGRICRTKVVPEILGFITQARVSDVKYVPSRPRHDEEDGAKGRYLSTGFTAGNSKPERSAPRARG